MAAKKYTVGEKRFVVIKKNEIRIFEDGTKKAATFTYPRWSNFSMYFEEIDNAVSKLIKGEEEVKLQLHVGGGWYVSVTTGYRCVDIRKFFRTRDGTNKASRTGIALRLDEWERLKQTAGEIKQHHPKIEEAQPCWTQTDHYNQEGAFRCRECHPFGSPFDSWFNAA